MIFLLQYIEVNMENMFRKTILVSLVCCCVYDFRAFSRCVNSPHFVSQWTEVEAQTQKSSITLEHECGEFPAKVELQIRPSSGNWTNFYFPGIGSSQRDDDINRTYGGIVYKYNKDEVILFIPKAKDGYPSGTIIYTGGSSWRGPVSQNARRASVRALVWCPNDFPDPTYESNWISLSNSVSGSFLEIAHNQGTIPDLITVQIQQSGTEWLSDGIGSMTALGPNTSSWGGVIYGYNSSHVRIWAPSSNNGKLFSADDGWGSASESWSRGLIKIKAWRITKMFTLTYDLNHNSKPQILLNTTYNQATDLLTVRVRADTGNNKGFVFPASGAVQNDETVSSFGGVIYSASSDTLRIWTPVTTGPGYLLYISSDWGNAMFTQASTTATLVVHVWKSTTCSIPTTPVPKDTTTTSPVQSSADPNSSKRQTSKGKNDPSSSKASIVIPAVIGGVGSILLIAGLIIARFLWKRKSKNRVEEEKQEQ